MRGYFVLGSIMLSASMLAGCSSNSGDDDPIPPFAGVFTPTNATADINSMAAAYAASPRIQGGAAPVLETFGAGASATRALADASAVELEKTDDGYILRYDDESVTFTANDLIVDPGGGDYYEDAAGNHMTAMSSASTQGALNATDSAMVPLRFGIRTSSTGQATSVPPDGFAQGYTVIGLETSESDMPTAGTATYAGAGHIEAYAREADYSDPTAVDRVRYRGAATLLADFGAGTVSGDIEISERRPRAGGIQSPWQAVATGATVGLVETQIIGNGFESELLNNAAANQLMDADGISADTEASAVGRFYGNDASQVGAVIGGQGTSHVITGVVYGNEQPTP